MSSRGEMDQDSVGLGLGANQPMSLMTVEANWRQGTNHQSTPKKNTTAVKEVDLLTLRILEASDRKMQLIRKLLTPEEYESVASSLFAIESEFEHFRLKNQLIGSKDQGNVSSVPSKLLYEEYDDLPDKTLQRSSKLSKSDTNLRPSDRNSRQEILAKRREALDFFFDDPGKKDGKNSAPATRQTVIGSADLRIELRSCHHINSSLDEKQVSKVIRDEGYLASTVSRFWAFLECVGFERSTDGILVGQDGKNFIEKHQRVNYLPYSRTSNLTVAYDRLVRDGHLGKLTKKFPSHDPSSSHLEPTDSSFEIITEYSTSINPSPATRPFRQIHSRRPGNFNKLTGLEHLDEYIIYHPLIELLYSKSNRVPTTDDQSSYVSKLYQMIYNESGTRIDDTGKMRRLINKIDPKFILAISGQDTEESIHPYFALDPFAAKLGDQDKLSGIGSIRLELLAWRWLNKLTNTPIYLSERENIEVSQSGTAKDFKSKVQVVMSTLKSHISSDPSQIHIYIESFRLRAIESIQEFERQIVEKLSLAGRSAAMSPNCELVVDQTQCQASRGATRKDILREPEFKLDLSSLVSVARRLAPRRRARRPLMPKRNLRSGNELARFFRKESAMSPVDLEASGQKLSPDHWHQQHTIGLYNQPLRNLRLVITVQQASNVPLRVSQQTFSHPSSRPISPSLYPMSRSSPSLSFVGQFQRPLTPTTNSGFVLLPATTYVEVVFQRNQQTSSLVQGKNPIWNETLFFPVSSGLDSERVEGDSSEARNSDRGQQLIDECLQLNLYDYNCYTIQEQPIEQQSSSLRSQQHEQSTLALMSSGPAPLLASETERIIKTSRLVASSQRVERHLLGSIRVPLSTILTNGRIEGSFALSRPLLLENYQFEPDAGQPSPVMGLSAGRGTRDEQETYLSLFITLDPPIAMPLSAQLPVSPTENDQLIRYAQLWEQIMMRGPALESTSSTIQGRTLASSRGSSQVRHVRAVVLQSDAKYCIISRLLFAMKPPSELITATRESNRSEGKPDPQEQMRIVARFVHLLSPLKYGLFNMRHLASSLWFNSGQLINKYLGGPEEKAILLCNYFLHMGKCSAILMGDSIAEGRCVYVVVWHEQARFVESQLQLQVGALIESIGGPSASETQLGDFDELARNRVDQSNFLTRFPILVNHKTVQLWNPMSGKSYSIRDHSPLISVGSIATIENVYANIQRSSGGQLNELNFDIRSRNCWFPLLESTATLGSASEDVATPGTRRADLNVRSLLQMSWRKQLLCLESRRKTVAARVALPPVLDVGSIRLNYRKFSRDEAKQLEETIDKTVKSHLLSWRPGRPTYFNRTLSRVLADKLAEIESKICKIAGSSSEQIDQPQNDENIRGREFVWSSELATVIRDEILATHLTTSSGPVGRQVISCPINVPFTSMKSILDSLFASGVHDADLTLISSPSQSSTGRRGSTLNTQFLVACHVDPIPARIMSVWLYVAAIVANPQTRLSLR